MKPEIAEQFSEQIRTRDADAEVEASCHDCGLPYGGHEWVDTVLSDEQWEMVFPERYGLLCANCIIRRASKLSAIIIAKMTLVFAEIREAVKV